MGYINRDTGGSTLEGDKNRDRGEDTPEGDTNRHGGGTPEGDTRSARRTHAAPPPRPRAALSLAAATARRH